MLIWLGVGLFTVCSICMCQRLKLPLYAFLGGQSVFFGIP